MKNSDIPKNLKNSIKTEVFNNKKYIVHRQNGKIQSRKLYDRKKFNLTIAKNNFKSHYNIRKDIKTDYVGERGTTANYFDYNKKPSKRHKQKIHKKGYQVVITGKIKGQNQSFYGYSAQYHSTTMLEDAHKEAEQNLWIQANNEHHLGYNDNRRHLKLQITDTQIKYFSIS